MKTFADRLKFAIETSGVGSQRQLALKAKLRPATITRWVQGETKKIRPTDIEAAARVLDVSPDWLLTGNGDMLLNTTPEILTTAHSPKPMRADRVPNAVLLEKIIAEAFASQLSDDPKMLATAIASTYSSVIVSNREDKIPDLVRMFLS